MTTTDVDQTTDKTTDLNLDWLISVDDHILEPPNLWVDRVAAKDRDRAPHTEFIDGMDYWVYDGKRYPSSGLSACAGKSVKKVIGHLPGETQYKILRGNAEKLYRFTPAAPGPSL